MQWRSSRPIALTARTRQADTQCGRLEAMARQRFGDGDADGSAEAYILYLNSTPEANTPERDEAKKFLHEQFNMVWPEKSA